jgi:hypothetical protein
MRMMLSAVCLFIVLSGVVGCNQLTRPPVDLASARISGEPTSADWDKAAAVSVPPDVKAQFLWNDKGIYCSLGCPGTRHVVEVNERICLAFVIPFDGQEKPGEAIFYLSTAGLGAPFPVGEMWVSPLWAEGLNGHGRGPLDARLYDVKASAIPSQFANVWPWRLNLFVSWEALTPDKAPPAKLNVYAYLLKGERPYAFLKLERSK